MSESRRLLRRVKKSKMGADGALRPESGQFEVSTREVNGEPADFRMSVDAEWVLLEAGDDIWDVCVGDVEQIGLVAIPIEIIDQEDGVAFELDGEGRPSHGGVFHVDDNGQPERRKLKQGFRKRLAKAAIWVGEPLPPEA